MPLVDVSIIICTYRRCAALRRTLASFSRVVLPPGLSWELIVVDNNSSDATPEVCAEFQDRLPLRYILESRQGKSHALHTAMSAARGALFLFTDDDVEVDPQWIITYTQAVARHPEISFFGGKVIPKWERPPPKWMAENCHGFLRNVAISLDFGPVDKELADSLHPFIGANLAFRRDLLQKADVSFRKDLGPTGNGQVRGEEAQLLRQLMEKGHRGLYLPGAVVHHCNPPERMTERYVRQWFKGDGISAVRLGLIESSEHFLFGAPRYLWRKLVTSALSYFFSRAIAPSETWLRHEARMAATWGCITEFQKSKAQ